MSAGLTLRDVAKKYKVRHIDVPTRRKHAKYSMKLHVDRLCDTRVPAAGDTMIALDDKPIAAQHRLPLAADV
jgi:hypothetical protein